MKEAHLKKEIAEKYRQIFTKAFRNGIFFLRIYLQLLKDLRKCITFYKNKAYSNAICVPT